MDNKPWKKEADIYKELLVTECTDVHFGTGLPGNKELNIILPANGQKTALDVGCGSGENAFALSNMGYRVFGIDLSERQIELARKASENIDELFAPRFKILAAEEISTIAEKFDLILSVGVLHFCGDLESVIFEISRHLIKGGKVVISMPHPFDMISDYLDTENPINISIQSYYPSGQKIHGARYWAKFGGAAPTGYDFDEYVYQISDIVNMFIKAGLCIESLYEPICDHKDSYPCRFAYPSKNFVEQYSTRMPQYFIFVASKTSE